MKKSTVIISLLFFAFMFYSAAFAEDITLTTYYPAPFGVYRELETRRLVIGDDDMPTVDGVVNFAGLPFIPAWNDPGALYYDGINNRFMYYDGSGWEQLGQCTLMTYTASSVDTPCPAGTHVASPPVNPRTTSGTFLCCPF